MLMDTPIEEWIKMTRSLLQLEKEAERAEIADCLTELSASECQQKGLSLLSLKVADACTALYGRTRVTVAHSKGIPLPQTHKFTVGDEVVLRASKKKSNQNEEFEIEEITGVVCRVSDLQIEFISDTGSAECEGMPAPLRLDALASEATHKKLMDGLEELLNNTDGPATPLIEKVFGSHPLGQKGKLHLNPPIVPINQHLNDVQIEAISGALASPDMYLIHGPPGTGKTTAVVELILQAVQRGLKLLVTAPSNVAVDNILERVATAKLQPRPKVVRIGHPARLSPQVLAYSLEALVQGADGTEIVQDVRAELGRVQKAAGGKGKGINRESRRALRAEAKNLRKELRQREEKVVSEILDHSNIILGTNVGAASKLLRNRQFDLVIIDEAAQALEVSCWLPAMKAPRFVLAGDHKQLPPTIKSEAAAKKGLGITLFDRLMSREGIENCSTMLNIQYRMNHTICDWASGEMYGGALMSDASVADHTVSDLSYVTETNELTSCTLLLIDTTGCDLDEVGIKGGSSFNEGEAAVTSKHIQSLIAAGLQPEDIAVITPYNGQVDVLKKLLREQFPTIEIRSVDGFQGGEREAVVLSLVRSNDKGEVGFLADDRRLNVAITRAKRHCAVVCNAECVSHHPFLKRLVEYIEEHGEVHSAMQYIDSNTIEMTAEDFALLPPPPVDTKSSPGPTPKKGPDCQVQNSNTSAKMGKKTNKKSPQDSLQKQAPRTSLKDPKYNIRTGAGQSKFKETISDEHIIQQVASFHLTMSENGDELVMPNELSARQRKLVHELCESKGLLHRSVGIGDSRHIIVQILPSACSEIKQSKESETPQLSVLKSGKGKINDHCVSLFQVHLSQDASDNSESESDTSDMEGLEVVNGQNQEPEGNIDCEVIPNNSTMTKMNDNSLLASLHAERLAREKKTGKLKLKQSQEAMEGLDDMALLDQAIKENRSVHRYKTRPIPNIWEKQRKDSLKASLQKKLSDQTKSRSTKSKKK